MRRIKGLVVFLVLTQLIVCLPINLIFESNNIQVSASTDTITEVSQYDDNYSSFLGLNVTKEIVAIPTNLGILFLNQTQKSFETEFELNTSYHNRDVAISNDIAYIVDEYGLTLLNITDLSNITVIDTFVQRGSKGNLEISEGYAYYIRDDSTIEIVNVSNVNQIKIVDEYHNAKSINSFQVKGDFIFGQNTDEFFVRDEFFAVNITEKKSSILIGNFTPYADNSFSSFDFHEDFAYLFYQNLNIVILNCSNPSNISIFKEIVLPRDYVKFILDEETAYCLRSIIYPYELDSFTIEILNFSNLDAVNSIGNFTTNSINKDENNRMTLFEKEIYCYGSYGLYFIDFNNLTDIRIIDHFSSGGYSSDILIEGNSVFIADNRDGLEIIDIENITNPTKISQSNHSYCSQLTRYQNYLFILSNNGQRIDIMRITDENELINLGHYESYTTFFSIDLLFPYLYLSYGFGFKILYVGNPEMPIEIGEYFESMAYKDIDIVDDYIYTIASNLDFQYFKIFDVGARTELTLISTFHITNITDCLEIKDGIAYIGIRGGVQILDISKPTNIKRLSAYIDEEYRETLSLHCTNNYLCIGSRYGVTVLDISNKRLPVKVGSYYDGYYGFAYGITSQDNYIFVADYMDNLEILETSFELNSPNKSKILVYILVPIGVIGIATIGTFVVIKIRKKRKLESGG